MPQVPEVSRFLAYTHRPIKKTGRSSILIRGVGHRDSDHDAGRTKGPMEVRDGPTEVAEFPTLSPRLRKGTLSVPRFKVALSTTERQGGVRGQRHT